MSASTTEIRLLLRSALMADHSIEARGTESRGAGFSPLHRPPWEDAGNCPACFRFARWSGANAALSHSAHSRYAFARDSI